MSRRGAISVLCILLLLFGFEYDTTVGKCVSDYEDFQNKTFSNVQNGYNLYKKFYPRNQHLPYAVDITYQTVLPNGQELKITDSNCNITTWRWLSSPIFLFSPPGLLNGLAIMTLNYFREWTTPSVILNVPYPCPNRTHEFLVLMTSLVSSSEPYRSHIHT